MIHYRCEIITDKRADGKNACAGSAYIAGNRIVDHATGAVYDFRFRKDIATTATIMPPGEASAFTAEQLWNAVEARERRYDARLARECRFSLPHQLSEEGKDEVAIDVAKYLAQRFHTVIEVARHRSVRKGSDPRNDHVHARMPTRRFEAGKLTAKLRKLDIPTTSSVIVEEIRTEVASIINRVLEKEGFLERVDHRSYKRQGLNKTPGTHDGPAKTAVRRKLQQRLASIDKEIGFLERGYFADKQRARVETTALLRESDDACFELKLLVESKRRGETHKMEPTKLVKQSDGRFALNEYLWQRLADFMFWLELKRRKQRETQMESFLVERVKYLNSFLKILNALTLASKKTAAPEPESPAYDLLSRR